MRTAFALAATFWLVAAAGAAEPANNFRALFAGFNGCMASVKVATGTDVTILFSLNRRGALIGKPRITHAEWPKDADPRASAQEIAQGFNRCLPASITDAFGRAIAGRPFVYRLRGRAPETKT